MQHRMTKGGASDGRTDEFAALLECMPQGVLVLDEHARIVAVNEPTLSLLGATREALVGHGLASLLASGAVGEARHVLTSAREPARTTAPLSLRKHDGGLVTATLRTSEMVRGGERVVVASIQELPVATPQGDDSARPELRALIDALPQLVWTCGNDTQVDLLNRSWVEFSGRPEREQLGFGWLQCVHPDDVEPMKAAAARAVQTGAKYEFELRMRRFDGEYRWFDSQALPVRGPTGEIVKWVGANTEIHASRELRERLSAEQERLAVILENSPSVLVAFERDAAGHTRFTYVSDGAPRLYGFSVAQIMADPALLFSHVLPDDLAVLQEALARSASERTLLSMEVRYMHPELGLCWHEGRSTPRFSADGRVTWVGLITDITTRKKMEEELRLTRAQLELALEAAGMGAWIWDCDRNKVWASEGQRRMWQLPSDTPAWFSRDLFASRIHPDDLPRVEAATEAAVQSGNQLDTEFRVTTPDGQERWIAGRAAVERAGGRALRVAGINLDVTQQKIATDTRLRAQKLEALGTLAGGIAHDFNNVLFAISGNAALALAKLPTDSGARAFLDDILRASRRATELVHQILAFSRPQDHKWEVLDLRVPVQEALRLVRASTRSTIEIETVLDPKTPLARVDAARVVQVIVNLCTNAAHAIEKGKAGHIEVRLAPLELTEPSEERVPAGRYALLSVRDDGCGIPDAIKSRIFDPFFTTKAPGEGTGLGLSVVHGIVRALGAHLTLWSQPGRGTIFRLYFPAVQEAGRPAGELTAQLASGGGERILFVDDERMLVTLGRSLLELLGYVPAAFQDPHEALATFRREADTFAALVTDLSMPAMSGFDLVRALRAQRPDLPVLMITGHLGAEERKIASDLRIDEIALKPLGIDELGEILARLCGRKASVGAAR